MATIELAISIRQPYVEQILLGVKPYEYRTTVTNIRGRVYMYAPKKLVDNRAAWRKARSQPGNLPTGVIVGSVVISGCKPWWRGGFRYKLEAPKRIGKHIVPNSPPLPKFFKAEGVDDALHDAKKHSSWNTHPERYNYPKSTTRKKCWLRC